jgi:hypothetical protein
MKKRSRASRLNWGHQKIVRWRLRLLYRVALYLAVVLTVQVAVLIIALCLWAVQT